MGLLFESKYGVVRIRQGKIHPAPTIIENGGNGKKGVTTIRDRMKNHSRPGAPKNFLRV
jgi:hypothetical protein